MSQSETVILVHGLAGTRLDMWPIARRLKQIGFKTRYFNYRSVGTSIETHAKKLRKQLEAIDTNSNGERFHLVAFSMGGIIARTMFAEARFERLGRVVMLAPPHRGSHTARRLAPYLGWLAPSLEQLSDEDDSFVNRLPNSLKDNEIEFGLVRASKDRVIAPDNIFLDGFQDFAIVNGHHGVLPWYSRTTDLVTSFLLKGDFKLTPASSDKPVSPTANAL